MHVSDPGSRAIAGPGFKDLTRVAAGNPMMWQQILSANADELRRAIQQLEKQLHGVDELLDPSRESELREWLSSAAAARQSIAQN